MSEDVSDETMAKVIADGDLSKLDPAQRLAYYQAVCKSLGLNPLTQPFRYLSLGGKVVLYAQRTCTDQLRTKHGVSITDLDGKRDGDLYVVTCKVIDREGRRDAATGAVSIAGLRGDALANQIMKSETKAKRRATLSLCGLGILDESEVESVVGAKPIDVNMHHELQDAEPRPAVQPPPPIITPEDQADLDKFCADLAADPSHAEFNAMLPRVKMGPMPMQLKKWAAMKEHAAKFPAVTWDQTAKLWVMREPEPQEPQESP